MNRARTLASSLGLAAVVVLGAAVGCGDDGGGGSGGSSALGGEGGEDGGKAGKGGKGGNGGNAAGGKAGRAGASSGGAAGEGATPGGGGEAGDAALAGRLTVDLTFATLLPDEQEFVTVVALADGGEEETATVASGDDSVASGTLVGQTLVIQANGRGETLLTVRSESGLTKTIDVLVSDPRVLKVGDALLVGFIDDFDFVYGDGGTDADLNGSYWAPRLPTGFFSLGHIGQFEYADPSGSRHTIVVRPLVADALAVPTDLEWIWDDTSSGGDMDGSFWRPICPTNYKALGAVAAGSHAKPPLDVVRCVRTNLTEPGAFGAALWSDGGSGADADFASWAIDVAPGSASEGSMPLIAGTFAGVGSYTQPASDPTLNLLVLGIPIVREIDEDLAFPKLESLLPPEETTPVQQGRAVLIPFTAVSDTARMDPYKVAVSPFYRLDRDVYYRRLVHQYNGTNVDQSVSHSVTTGVSREKSEEFSITTGISITVEGGVSFIASASTSVTVSLELGYSTSTTIGEFREESVSKDVVVPPQSAAALWQLIHRFSLKRRNGNSWETVGAPWEIGVNSFVVDTYPD